MLLLIMLKHLNSYTYSEVRKNVTGYIIKEPIYLDSAVSRSGHIILQPGRGPIGEPETPACDTGIPEIMGEAFGFSIAAPGAGCRIRTRDLRFTKPLLYQLS